jgi:hypothetical protein
MFARVVKVADLPGPDRWFFAACVRAVADAFSATVLQARIPALPAQPDGPPEDWSVQ